MKLKAIYNPKTWGRLIMVLMMVSAPFLASADGFRELGNVTGHVYEQDGITPIDDATVSFIGTNIFGDTIIYQYVSDVSGAFSGSLTAGPYTVKADATGYAETVLPNQVVIVANSTTNVNVVLHEDYLPVNYAMANVIDNSMVKVSWGMGEPVLLEDFETGDFGTYEWDNAVSGHPWAVSGHEPYQGSYCMKSTNEGIQSSTSAIQVMIDVPKDGKMSFFGKISCEQTWDYGSFYIDGALMGTYQGNGIWQERIFNVTQGRHLFRWEYVKDASTNANDDCFYVDYIRFYYKETPFTGEEWITYSNDDYYTNVSCDEHHTSWGCLWPAAELSRYIGASVSKVSYFSDAAGYAGGDFTVKLYLGGDSYPDSLVSEQIVTIPDSLGDYAEFELNTTVPIDGTRNLWLVWSAPGIAYPATACSEADPGRNGTWWGTGTTWSQSSNGAWMTKAFVTDAKGCETTISKNGHDRSFQYFNVWRRRMNENPVLLASHLSDSAYMDLSWNGLQWGTYHWGVSCDYEGNRAESPIVWSGGIGRNLTTTAEFNVTTNSGASPAGALITLTNSEGNGTNYTAIVDQTGHYVFNEVRRAGYFVSVALDGYQTYASDSIVPIYDPVVINCELVEVINGLDSLYVSNTGWAIWRLDESKDVVSYDIMLDSVSVGSVTDTCFQHNVANLVEGQQYLTSVRAVYLSGTSAWISRPWTYHSCDAYAGTHDGLQGVVNDDHVVLSWTYSEADPIVGALLYRDGERLGFTTDSTFTEIFPAGLLSIEYGIRIIHGGPLDGTYYSMSCEESVTLQLPVSCEAPVALNGEEHQEGNDYGALVSWGPRPAPVNEWLYYDNGIYQLSLGAEGLLYWGVKFDTDDLADYEGCSLTQVSIYDASAGNYVLSVYLDGNYAPQTLALSQNMTLTGANGWHTEELTFPVSVDVSRPIWIVVSQTGIRNPAAASSDTGDSNGRWVSLNGSTWNDLAAYDLHFTWMLRGFVSNRDKSSKSELGHRNGQDYVLDHYNLYKSYDNIDYQLYAQIDTIGGVEYYEYFDSFLNEPQNHIYYKVTAYYADSYGNTCESDPALSEQNPAQDYVHVYNVLSDNGLLSEKASLTPNPTTGLLNVKMQGMKRLTVMNAMGQTITDVIVDTDALTLDLSGFANGLYLLHIVTAHSDSFEKVMVAR